MGDQLEEVKDMTDEQFREFVVKFQGFVIDRLIAGERQFLVQQQAIAENTNLTREGNASIKQIVEVFAVTQKGAHVLSVLGQWANRIARWLQPILMVVGAVWAIVHGHAPRGEE
ncbi:MAG: hypothetical protein P4L91_08525 [Burkholderiaceae bacterium]|nr:hypothetical protein [Burkholderiaceae bacterium]